jgi:hypothetical protein
VDGVSFVQIEVQGLEAWLAGLREDGDWPPATAPILDSTETDQRGPSRDVR